MTHLEVQKKLNSAQHGFRSNRSCLTQLIQHYDDVLKILENGDNCDSIYLDFSKAFDKVDHGILLHKMKQIGIDGKIALWISNFLSNREQQVVVNGTRSKPSIVKSGVPQGTVLGPILFLLLINDIDQNIDGSRVAIFADDTRVFRAISDVSCVEKLQDDLEMLYLWEKENNMQFNAKKFELLRYGGNEHVKMDTLYFTPNMDQIIEDKSELRDLGVIMSNDMKFSKHVSKICTTVRQKSGWVLRTFSCRQEFFMKLMWKSLLQPHIDYCSQLYFSPSNTGDIEQLENLQRNFTGKIPSVRSMNYWERLKHLRMRSQQRRLERYRILYTWKVLEERVPNCGISASNCERKGRLCNIPKINKNAKKSVQNLREDSFQVNGPRLFNCIPAEIRNMTRCHIDDFKFKLDNFLNTIPDEPKVPHLIPTASNMMTANPSNSLVDQIRSCRK